MLTKIFCIHFVYYKILFLRFLWWLYDKNIPFSSCVVDGGGFAKRKPATITSNLYVFCTYFSTFCIQETCFVYILYIHHTYKLSTHTSIIVTKFVQDTYFVNILYIHDVYKVGTLRMTLYTKYVHDFYIVIYNCHIL